MRRLCVLLLILIATSTYGYGIDSCVVDLQIGSCDCTGVITGPHEIRTAMHCMMDRMHESITVYLPNGETCTAINDGFVWPLDTQAAVLKTDKTFEVWWEIGKAQLGPATLHTLTTEEFITILPNNQFAGYRPWPGQSGSPILQNGKVVGLLITRNMTDRFSSIGGYESIE